MTSVANNGYQEFQIGNLHLAAFDGMCFDRRSLEPNAVALGTFEGDLESMPDVSGRLTFFSYDMGNRVGKATHAFNQRSVCVRIREALVLGMEFGGRKIVINSISDDILFSLWLLRNPDKAHLPRVDAVSRAISARAIYGEEGLRLVERDDIHGVYAAFVSALVMSGAAGLSKGFGQWPAIIEDSLRLLDKVMSGGCDRHKGVTLVVEDKVVHDETASVEMETLYEGETRCGFKAIFVKSNNLEVCRKLYDEGYRVVAVEFPLMNQSSIYFIGKMSRFVDYSLGPKDVEGSLADLLNKLEPGWDGTQTMIQSPRDSNTGTASILNPIQVWNEVVAC